MSGCTHLARSLHRVQLGDSLSARIPITGERLPLHDRGKVLTRTAGSRPWAKTAGSVPQRPWLRSPAWSICRAGRRVPG